MNEVRLSDLKPDERALFNGSVIDLSGASKYYKRQMSIASHVEDMVGTGQDRYQLSPRILSQVIAMRRLGVGGEHEEPANRLAHSVFVSARWFGFESYLRMQRTKNEEWSEYFEAVKAHGPVRLRASQRRLLLPVGKNGEMLEEYSHPELPQLKLHLAFNTELASIKVGGLPGVAGIPETITVDETMDDNNSQILDIEHLPGFSIKMEGAPVSQMMIATFDRNTEDVRAARAYTLRLLNGVMHEVKRFLRLVAKKGRPRLGIGERAAVLLDHERKNIVQVTKGLCPSQSEPGHRHSKRCYDRVRLAAEQYYRSLEREFTRSLPSKGRKT